MIGGLKTPDITLAQITAALGWLVAQLLAMGVIDNDQAQLTLQIGSTAVAAVWTIADAIIRNGRARAFVNPPKPIDDGGGPLTGTGRGA